MLINSEEKLEKLYDNIKDIRIKKGYSHENMAIDLDISQGAYSKLENRKTKLSVDSLFKIAEILNTSISNLIDEEQSFSQTNHNENNETVYNQQHIENLVIDESKEHIKSLKEEIKFLREQLKK